MIVELKHTNTSRKYWKRRNLWETFNGFNLYPSKRFLCSIEMIYFQLGQNPDEWTMTSNIIIRSLDGWKKVDMTTLFWNKNIMKRVRICEWWDSEIGDCKPNFGLELRCRLNSHQLSHDGDADGQHKYKNINTNSQIYKHKNKNINIQTYKYKL